MRPTSPHLLASCLLLLWGGASSSLLADDPPALVEEKPTDKPPISLQLPKNWQLAEPAGSRNLLLAHAPKRDKDITGEFQTLLTIDADTVAKLDARAEQARIAKAYTNYKITEEPTPVTLNGLEATMFGGTFTLNSVKLRCRQYLLLQNNKLYILTFTTLDSAWPTYAPAIEASAATFTVASK